MASASRTAAGQVRKRLRKRVCAGERRFIYLMVAVIGCLLCSRNTPDENLKVKELTPGQAQLRTGFVEVFQPDVRTLAQNLAHVAKRRAHRAPGGHIRLEVRKRFLKDVQAA